MSIGSQIEELQTIAARRGIRIAEVLEESKSAKAPGRPEFGKLMTAVKRGKISGIFCWKMDRLSRNHMDTGTILQALADGALEQIVTPERTYTKDGNDRFMGNFELGMATKYIDDLSVNVRRGIRARLQKGWLTHNPPLGYLIDSNSRTIVKDPDRFDLVRRMWDLLIREMILPNDILKIANEKWGFRTRRYKRIGDKPLSRSTLYRMLQNPFYMGVIRLRSGDTYAGAHEPMVTREEFDRAQEILGRPGRQRPQRHEFAFTGLIRCAGCNGMITAEEHVKPSGNRYIYYRCSRRKKGTVCREPAVAAPDLVEQIARRLDRITMPEKVQDWFLKRLDRELAHEQARNEEVRKTLQRSVEKAVQEEETLLSLRLRNLVNDDVFVARRKILAEKRESFQAKLNGPNRSPEEVQKLTRETVEFAANAASAFRTGTRVQQRLIAEAVGLNYTLQSRKAAFQLKKPFSSLAKSNGLSNWSGCVDDVRTWILNENRSFWTPDLQNVENTNSMPQNMVDDHVG